MFVDQAKIWVKAGNGGPGCMSFRREKFIPKGGPDGGDGGKGGDIYFKAAGDVDTLGEFAGKHHWQAGNGKPGEGSNKTGHDGEDLVITVPTGTIIYDEDLDIMLKDLNTEGQKVCVCRGGIGGKGNKAFTSSTRQAPRFSTAGKVGQERNIRLELKLIADVGLVGLPNAGKSTLISRCSAARPKVADYPFTTLEPCLGIVELVDFRRFVMADIPGLIEGAHKGAGLGHEFLRHIERTRILAHVLDIMPSDGSDPVENFAKIQNELAHHSPVLAQKPVCVVLNKIDLDADSLFADDIIERLDVGNIYRVSAVSGEGLRELNEGLWQMIQERKL